MKVSKDEFERASARAAARLRKTPCAMKARYERKRDRVVVELSSGIEVALRPGDAQGLESDCALQAVTPAFVSLDRIARTPAARAGRK